MTCSVSVARYCTAQKRFILQGTQATRHHVSLRRFTPGCRGFYNFDLAEGPLQKRQQLLESVAVEGLDEENAGRVQRLAAKLHGRHGELEQAGLVDVGNARQVG